MRDGYTQGAADLDACASLRDPARRSRNEMRASN
jgi:hypothetical protein